MAQEVRRTLLEVGGERREFALTRPSMRDYAMLEELSFVRREAQAEADEAYVEWRDFPSGETWTIYQAAADRADAALDELAHWSRQLAACA